MSGRDRCVAVVVVVIVQWNLFGLLRTTGTVVAPGAEVTPLRVRYVERVELAPGSLTVSVLPDAGRPNQRHPIPARVRPDAYMPSTSGVDNGLPGEEVLERLNLALPQVHTPDFSRQVLEGDTRLDRFAAPAERIPMRKPLAGKDVIEGAAQILGFWPPGYTTDPCPRIRRNIDAWKTDGSAAGRERLEQEMARQARYCP